MLVDLFRTRKPRAAAESSGVPRGAYSVRRSLMALRDSLLAAPSIRHSRRTAGEPPVFFFNSPANSPEPRESETHPPAACLRDEIAALCQSAEVRQTARAIPGLHDAVNLAHARLPAMRTELAELAALLAVPDDETILVVHPKERWGGRILVRGIASANQFQVLMLDALELPVPRLPERFAAACRTPHSMLPAGVPMVVELPYQLLRSTALQPDGTVLEGFRGCDHWLWGWESLAAAPRFESERIVLLGEPAYPQTWEVDSRFPAMDAEASVMEMLNPFQVNDVLSRIAGQPLPINTAPARRVMSKAA